MKKMLFGIIATVMMSTSGFANKTTKEIILKSEIINYSIDGKTYSPIEYSKLDTATLTDVKACEITITKTIDTPQGPRTFTYTDTVDMSWWGCLIAQVAAFIASVVE